MGELCKLIGIGQSALSQHLAKLRGDNIVKTRRKAQTVYYSIASPEIYDVLAGLQEVLTGEEGQPKTLRTLQEPRSAS